MKTTIGVVEYIFKLGSGDNAAGEWELGWEVGIGLGRGNGVGGGNWVRE